MSKIYQALTIPKIWKEGYSLALVARRKELLDTLAQELQPAKVFTCTADLSSREEAATAMQEIEKKLGSIDVLVNNAGNAFNFCKAYEAQLEDWEKCIHINVQGLVYCTHAALPGMVKRNHGHIINLGSIASSWPYPGGNVYGATKAFVKQFSLNLRADLLGSLVRVSCIEPGIVGETEFSLVRFKGDKAKAQEVYNKTEPLKPEDIADIIYFSHSLPPHVNINLLEVMPTYQAYAGFSVHRI